MRRSIRNIIFDSGVWDFDVFSPTEIPFWMSLSPTASKVSAISFGTNVSGITDVSGNARHLSQSTGASQPVYQATGFNGLPTIAFDGVDDFLSFSVPQAYNQACFAVVDTTNIGAGYRVFLQRTFTNGEPALYLGGSGAGVSYAPLIFWAGDRAPQNIGIQSRALVFWRLGSNGAGENLTDVNASRFRSQSNTQSAISSWTSINSGIVQQSNIKLSELVILNNPSQDFIDKAHGILAHRWWRLAGQPVPLPANHPYFVEPPIR